MEMFGSSLSTGMRKVSLMVMVVTVIVEILYSYTCTMMYDLLFMM